MYDVNCWCIVKEFGLPCERVRVELMGMDFKSLRIHLRCELLGPCEGDGACLGKGSELNSLGWILNPLEFICAVNCWGLVKGMGLV